MKSTSCYRHQPDKSVLKCNLEHDANHRVNWLKEPVVCGYRKLNYFNKKQAIQVDVPISATPAVVDGIGIIAATDDGFLRFFSADLSRVYWERRLPASVYASLVVDSKRKHIIVCTTSGIVTCFNMAGMMIWLVNLEYPIFATPAIDVKMDLLSIATFHHRGYILSLETGQQYYTADLIPPWYHKNGLVSYRNPYASPAMTAEGNSLFCSGEYVILISASGEKLWCNGLNEDIKASPIYIESKNEVAVQTVAGNCYFLDCDSGQVIKRIKVNSKITSSGAISGNYLAIGTVTGNVYCIDVVNYKICWIAEYGAPYEYTSITVTPNGHFISTNQRGNITCLDCEDGSFLWETSQVMGLPNHETAMHITPMICDAGYLYCGSYHGDLYQFSFQNEIGETDETK